MLYLLASLEYILVPAFTFIIDLFRFFDQQLPLSIILLSFFFVSCCYRFIITRFLSGAPISPLEALSDNVKAHSKSDRAGNKQKQNDKGKNKSKVASTSHSSD